MGIIRLTLLTLALIWLAMMFFGRDEGLPERVIGREPPAPAATPDPVRAPDPPAAATPKPEPETEPPVATAPEESIAPTPADSMQDAIGAAIEEAMPEPETQAAPEPEPVPEPVPEPAPADLLYVTGAAVNVRSGPSTIYAAITALPRGTAVVDLGDAGEGWRMIRLESGETGYMSGDFLSPVAP